MKNKSLIFSIFLVFIIVLSVSAISAQDVNDTISTTDEETVIGDAEQVSGTVSGDVDVATENPWNTTGELSYDIPADAKTIKSADVYVNVYSGSAQNTYGANANISISTANGNTRYSESLWTEDGSADGTVYTVNNHTTKCYSDYMIHYDVTDMLQGLNGTNFKVTVDTFNMTNKTFDGRIKLIALVLAYDDGDDDVINYWVDANQLWSKTNVTIPFNTIGKSGSNATLTNVVLSSGDGTYRINGNFLVGQIDHKSGNYYQYNKWDVSDVIDKNINTSLNVAYAGTSAYGSIKNVLSVLKIEDINTTISLKTEYTSTPSAFAGTNNTLTVTVSTTKSGKYIVRLLANDTVVNETEIELKAGSNTVLLTDPTIRSVDNTTVNGAENKKVNYTVELALNNILNSTSITVPVVYNGYLGKDLAYPAGGMDSLDVIIINGDIVVETKEAFLSGAENLNKTDIWTINLGDDSTIVKSFVYVPYTWCNPPSIEGPNMFNVTFNGEKITPIALYRDQSNLGGASGKYGYGVLVYDVTSLINKTGDNTLFLSKNATYPGVYSSSLVYMYNTTNSKVIKEIYFNHGADILYNNYNVANRPIKSDSTFVIDSKDVLNATLYVFASNAQNNYADLVFNGETTKNIFPSGKSYVTSYYTLDVTDKIKDVNSVSVVGASKNTFLTLHQIMVLTKNVDDVEISLKTEYTSTPSAFAGTNNTLTVTIDVVKSGKYTVKLLADNTVVNETEIDLNTGSNTVLLTDPTIRSVDNTTVNGAEHKKVNYTVEVALDGAVNSASISVPVVYNGYLGKDLAYPAGGMDSLDVIIINGDIVVETKEAFLSGAENLNKTDIWTINLGDDSTIVKSFVYVPYTWCNPPSIEGPNMFNVTFNGEKITPIALYRDQSNLGGASGKYGYGVLVYDVTSLINKTGDNTLFLSKNATYPGVYSSSLVYMYNTTNSKVIKEIYFNHGADILYNNYNVANRPIKSDSTFVIDSKDVLNATLYVFASNAQNNYADLVFNGETTKNIFPAGKSYVTSYYALDVTGKIKDNNTISVVGASKNTFLAIQQIMVVTKNAPTPVVKTATKIIASSVKKVYNVNKKFTATLKDANNKAISDVKVTITLNGKTYTRTTNAKGQVILNLPNLAPKTYKVSVKFAGDSQYKASSLNTAKVVVKKATPKMTAKKKSTFKAKTKVKKLTVTLKTNKGKVMKKVKLTLKINKKTYKATTNKKGKAIFKITKLTKKGTYTGKVTYKGNKYYNKVTKSVKIAVKK